MLPNWLIDTEEPKWEFDLTLDITSDLGAKLTTITKPLNNFKFDSRLEAVATGDELIGFDGSLNEGIDYTGNVASIQTPIYKT